MTKAYRDYTHFVNLSTSYVKDGFSKRSGFYEENEGVDCRDPKNNEICEFYNISSIQEAITLNFSHYLFDTDNKQIIYHRLTNIVAKTDKDTYEIGELENELDFDLGEHWNYYNNFFYNFDQSAFSKQFNKITFKYEGLKLSLSHLYAKKFTTNAKTSYITSKIGYRYNTHYSYNASLDYDTELDLKKRLTLSFLYQKRCWDFGLSYVENNRPVLLENNTPASVYDRYIYLTLVLKPIMSRTSSGFFGIRLPEVMQGY
jgi:LPS-assembly protein